MRSPTTPSKGLQTSVTQAFLGMANQKEKEMKILAVRCYTTYQIKNPTFLLLPTKKTALLYKSHSFLMTFNHWLKFWNKSAIYWLLDMLDIISSINNWSDDISIIYCYSQQYFSEFNQPFHQFFEIYFPIFLAFISQSTLVKDSVTHLKSCWWEIRTLTGIMEMQLHLH